MIHASDNKNIFLRADGTPANIGDLFHGQSAVLVCNGPSAADIDPAVLNRPGFMVMGVNNGAHVIRPNLWCGQDAPTKFMASIWEDPRIMKFTRRAYAHQPYWKNGGLTRLLIGSCPNVFYHKLNSDTNPDGWLDRPSVSWAVRKGIRDHRVTIFMCALCVLYKLGFKRVAVVGADFTMTKETPYFFNETKSDHGIVSNNELFTLINAQCARMIPYFEQRKFHVVNCTPKSGLTAFPAGDLEACLEGWTLDMSEPTLGMYTHSSPTKKPKTRPVRGRRRL